MSETVDIAATFAGLKQQVVDLTQAQANGNGGGAGGGGEIDEAAWQRRFIPGGTFILDAPEGIPAIWGDGEQVVWAEGEPLMLCGGDGVGKTTLAQQATLGRVGLRRELLGFPIIPGTGAVLYLACDRPRQAQRSFGRMVSDQDREILDEKLRFWKGPLPADVSRNPGLLLLMCREMEADTLVIDSVKDVAFKLSDDEVGAKFNSAIQECIASDIQVLMLHHSRKKGAENKNAKPTIDDIYGSRWIYGGCGSIIILGGDPGSELIDWHHVKQPGEPIGPFRVRHNHYEGTSVVAEAVDVLAMVRDAPVGITSVELAGALHPDVDKPGRGELEAARRKLEALVRKGLVFRMEQPSRAVTGKQLPARYVAVTRAEEPTEEPS